MIEYIGLVQCHTYSFNIDRHPRIKEVHFLLKEFFWLSMCPNISCACEWVSRIDELDLNAFYDINLILCEIKPEEEKRILFCWPKVLMASRQYDRVSKLGANILPPC